jgi:hypothetical protein
MSRPRPWKFTLAAGLAGLTAIAGAGTLIALSRPGEIRIGAIAVGLSGGFDEQAFRRLAASRSQRELNGAAAEASRALALSPYDNSARLRLTYIDTVRHGGLRTEGVAQLSKSYDLIPYDHTVAAWRIGFALEHWDSLAPQDREAVRAEATAFAKANSQAGEFRNVLRSIHNPNGRLAAALWLQALNR